MPSVLFADFLTIGVLLIVLLLVVAIWCGVTLLKRQPGAAPNWNRRIFYLLLTVLVIVPCVFGLVMVIVLAVYQPDRQLDILHSIQRQSQETIQRLNVERRH